MFSCCGVLSDFVEISFVSFELCFPFVVDGDLKRSREIAHIESVFQKICDNMRSLERA